MGRITSTMARSLILAAVAVSCIALATAEVYFEEDFSGDWESRWIQSKAKDDLGAMKVSSGKYFGDEEAAKGLQTSQDAKFYAISAKTKEFSNEGKDLVIQYTVKFEQDIDCGGGYLKVGAFEPEKFEGESKYNIMFGPDICGSSTKKTHVIFNYNDKNLDKKSEVKAEKDTLSHLYTLIVKPDNTYEVQIDMGKVADGSLEEGWPFLEPKEIRDPDEKKPEDWVDEEMMDDPEDKKPEGYDDIPAKIADPKATKPDDWDDEDEGEWEAPMIDNPDYKGPWSAKRIKNPKYVGVWKPKQVDNPNYDEKLVTFPELTHVGFELWTVNNGTISDNIYVGDSIDEANALAKATSDKTKGKEKDAKDAWDKARKAAEEAKKEAEKEDDDDEDDDMDDEDEDDEKKEL